MKRFFLPSLLVGILGCTSSKIPDPNIGLPAFPERSPQSEASEDTVSPTEGRDDGEKYTTDSRGYNGQFARFNYDGYKGGHAPLVKHLAGGGAKELRFMSDLSNRRGWSMQNGLFDSGVDAPDKSLNCDKHIGSKSNRRRSVDGRCYFYGTDHDFDKAQPNDDSKFDPQNVGAVGTRFGRNASPEAVQKAFKEAHANLMNPNPRKISKVLFSRRKPGAKPVEGDRASADGTIEAKTVNLWAAAWLQAMNHDWFSHGKNQKGKSHKVPAYKGDREFRSGMEVPLTRAETEKESSLSKGTDRGFAYNSRNMVTHWWDAGQLYGNDQKTIDRVRCDMGGKSKWKNWDEKNAKCLKTLPNGHILVDKKRKRLFYDKYSLPITGFHDNWWVGLDLIHSLFAMEHNYVADLIAGKNGGKADPEYLERKERVASGAMTQVELDNWVFDKTRLVISALMAKIHTVEWTPAVLDNKTMHVAMRANWYGLKEGWLVPGLVTKTFKLFGYDGLEKKGLRDSFNGLVGKGTLNLNGVPFTLTEEFTAVYRMHPLIPEAIRMRNYLSPKRITLNLATKETIFRKAPRLNNTTKKSLDMAASFGMSHPGLLVIRNHPTFMQNITVERNKGEKHSKENTATFDLVAVDIIRDRARGVPRYNDFRKALNLPVAKSYEDLVGTQTEYQRQVVADLKEVYGPDGIDKVDLLVGCMAERDVYEGYGFGNTSFYLFALMASRRLKADPFFSDFYNEEVYTQTGYDHLEGEKLLDGVEDRGTKFMHVLRRHYPEFEKRGIFKGVRNGFRPWQPVYTKIYNALNPQN